MRDPAGLCAVPGGNHKPGFHGFSVTRGARVITARIRSAPMQLQPYDECGDFW